MERHMKGGGTFDPKVFLTTNSGATISKYPVDQTVFAQGSSADAVFHVQTGRVKISILSEQGKTAVVAILGPGAFFGEECLAGQMRRAATTTAITECEIMRLTKASTISLLSKEPAFAEIFITHLLARAIRVEEDLTDHLFYSSEKRLARALLRLANFGMDERAEPITAKVSHATLAEMIGTTRSRVNFFMNKFRRLGLIDYNGYLVVHSALSDFVRKEGRKAP
jgi:CRP/FNR family cyclic AMP-dependent transcriptional regulator